MSSAALSTRSRVSAHALSFYTSLSAPSVLGERQEVDRRGFLKSESRAGGPVLCSIPARYEEISTRYDHHVAIRRNRVEIQNMVEEILEGLRIEYMRVVVCGRRSKVQPEAEPIPTVLVVMPTPSISQAQSWYNTAKEIHRKLDRRFRGISVELIERRLNRGFRCDPVHSTHSLYQKWERIVCSILRTSDVREWMIVECWHFGTESDPALNPVTLIVSVQATSTSRFTTSARRIHGILTNNNEADVNVLFVKDQTTKLTENPTVPWQACNQYVQPGISLGIHNSCAESSTLGGLVQLKHKNDPIWHTYAMTCFHCVWPEPKYRADLPVVEGGEQGEH